MNFHSQSATFTRLSFDFFFAKQIITLDKEIISPFFQNEKIYFCQDRGVNFVYITILPRKIRIIVFQSVIKILFKSRNCIKFSRAQFLFLSYHVSLDLYSVSNEILTRDNFFPSRERMFRLHLFALVGSKMKRLMLSATIIRASRGLIKMLLKIREWYRRSECNFAMMISNPIETNDFIRFYYPIIVQFLPFDNHDNNNNLFFPELGGIFFEIAKKLIK